MRSVSPARPPAPASDSGAVLRPDAWPRPTAVRPIVALLLVGSGPTDAFEPLRRCFATALPECDLVPFVAEDQAFLVRRCFAEAKADAFVVAGRLGDPLAVARAVAAITAGDADLVLVTAEQNGEPATPAARLLAATLAYLFGCGAGALAAEAVACSRRVATDYAGRGGALDLALHALRRRMPVREIEARGPPAAVPSRSGAATPRAELARLLLVGRLFAAERPRRTFGFGGIGLVGAGIATALPAIHIHDWTATLSGATSATSLALVGAGIGAGIAGLLLDTVVAARQDVTRIGYQAMAGDAAPCEPWRATR